MNDAELIAKQQHQIHELEAVALRRLEALKEIKMAMICIGGPLNDNVLGFTNKQIGYLSVKVLEVAESGAGE